jgi:hypothetical protein
MPASPKSALTVLSTGHALTFIRFFSPVATMVKKAF